MTKSEVNMKLVYQAIKESRIEQLRVRRAMWEKEHQQRHQRLMTRGELK